MRGISIDIGTKNLAVYIEEFDRDVLQKIKNIPPNQRYNKDGTVKPSFKKILDKVFKEGRKILLEKVDISSKYKGCKGDQEMFINATKYLNSRKKFFEH